MDFQIETLYIKLVHLSDKPMDSYGSLVWKPPTSHRISYHIISTYLISSLHSPGHPWKPHVSRHNPGFTEPTICSWPAPRKHDLEISGYLSGGQWCTDGWTCIFVGTRIFPQKFGSSEFAFHFDTSHKFEVTLPRMQAFIVAHMNDHQCASQN